MHPDGKDTKTPKGDYRVSGVCCFLVILIWAVFGQTVKHEFVGFDDQVYVYENPVVIQGISLQGIKWTFTHCVAGNWHPLTMQSHMLDCQVFGLHAGGHHLTSMLIHTATAILLFCGLRRITRCLWRSAFVAAVFAIHPLRVESVAWVAERKDVLSGLFFMLTVWAYLGYVQRTAGKTGDRQTDAAPARGFRYPTFNYGLVLLFFALGLMCKPMLVTLPLVLLLLDFWPLNRWTAERRTALLLEKLPLAALAIASCIITMFAQNQAVLSGQTIPLALRLGNALISWTTYLQQMFWPSDLAVLYPFRAADIGAAKVALSSAVLAGISVCAFAQRQRRPYLLTGWLWYLIMLLPVIGIVQVGIQARADRYTYLPQIGLYALTTWLVADLGRGWRHGRWVLGGGGAIILAALLLGARAQTSYWQNSETLWNHTLACTPDNYDADNNLGYALLQNGRCDEAMVHFCRILRSHPDFVDAHSNLGRALAQKGRWNDAIAEYQTALRMAPGQADVCNNLGNALLQSGQINAAIAQYQRALQLDAGNAETCFNLGLAFYQLGQGDEAIARYQTALRLNPAFAKAYNHLGQALCQKGSLDQAVACCEQALKIKPDYLDAHYNLAVALARQGRASAAIAHYKAALHLNPDHPEILNNLALLLAASPDAGVHDGAQAVQYARHACELTQYHVPIIVSTLAVAYAEAGQFDDAIATAQKACDLASAAGQADLLQKDQQLLALFRTHHPYREATP